MGGARGSRTQLCSSDVRIRGSWMAELPNDGLSPPFSRGVSLERSHFDVRFELWLVLVVADFLGGFGAGGQVVPEW